MMNSAHQIGGFPITPLVGLAKANDPQNQMIWMFMQAILLIENR